MKHLHSHQLAVVCICVALAAMLVASSATPLRAAPARETIFSGCRGDYYSNTTADGPIVFSRMDPAINFEWPDGVSPDPGISSPTFSVRWTCTVQVPETRDYRFTYSTDDGMNIIVDEKPIRWDFVDQSASDNEPATYYRLTAGTHTIKVEYYNAGGRGVAWMDVDIPGWNIVPVGQCGRDCSVRTDHATVLYGDPANHLIELPEDDPPRALTANNAVTTIDDGEAWVHTGVDGCQDIYVWRESKLRFSPCTRSESTGGNISCLEQGMAQFHDTCPGAFTVVQTPDEDIVLQGTVVEVSYHPALKLTAVAVLTGTVLIRRPSATAQPDFQVPSGSFWYTFQDVKPAAVLQTASGPLAQMPDPVIRAAFVPVADRVFAHAFQNNVDVPETFIQKLVALPPATPTPTPSRSTSVGPIAIPTGASLANPPMVVKPRLIPTGTPAPVSVSPFFLYSTLPTRTPTPSFKAGSILANRAFLQSNLSQLRLVMQRPLVLAPEQKEPADAADLIPVTVYGVPRRSPTLKWNAMSGATSYTVEIDPYGLCRAKLWCNDVGKTWALIPGIGPGQTQYTFDYPQGAQEVRWRVKAVLADRTTPWSGWWTFAYSR